MSHSRKGTQSKLPPDEQHERSSLLKWVMLAILVWGCVLATGALLYGFDAETNQVQYQPNWRRGIIAYGCVLTFVGSWAVLLRRKKP